MIQSILELIQEALSRNDTGVMIAWVQYLPAILGAGSAIYGGLSNARARRDQRNMIKKWNAENLAGFNRDYYGDYTQSQEAQNVIRQAREMYDRGAERDANTAAVMGGTVEAQAAGKESRNRAMGNLFAHLGAQGTRMKERAKDRYNYNKNRIQAMQYGQAAEDADSAGNLMYNGFNTLAGMDWASIMGGGKNPLAGVKAPDPITPVPVGPVTVGTQPRSIEGIIPSYAEIQKKNPL